MSTSPPDADGAAKWEASDAVQVREIVALLDENDALGRRLHGYYVRPDVTGLDTLRHENAKLRRRAAHGIATLEGRCPVVSWCDPSSHDDMERVRELTHWRRIGRVECDATAPELPDTQVAVYLTQRGFAAPATLDVAVGDARDNSASLSVDQAATLVSMLEEAIQILKPP